VAYAENCRRRDPDHLLNHEAVPACTGPSEDADKAYHRGDYKTAYRLFKQLAEQGNVKAQNNLGEMSPKRRAAKLRRGHGSEQQARKCSPVQLGLMYVLGQQAAGLRRGDEAVQESADQGNALPSSTRQHVR
jgi:TPR repeat protein